jgi:ribA/ribD-fused uncharacterized protein
MPINKFRGEYFFLSNFFPCKNGVEFEEDIYPTTEHAYQAAKIEDRTLRDAFTRGGSLGDNPMDAKSKGGYVKMQPGWDRLRVNVMLTVVRSKFSRDEDLQKKLLATKNQKIVEGHTGDKFWGGKANHLGNILMRVRCELQGVQRIPRCLQGAGDQDVLAASKQRIKGQAGRNSIFQHAMDTWTESKEPDIHGAETFGIPTMTKYDSMSEKIAAYTTDDADVTLGGEFVAEAEAEAANLLPPRFQKWLSQSLLHELGMADAEGILAAVEVLLSYEAVEGSNLADQLGAAIEVLKDNGAPECAADLAMQWHAS